MAAEILRRSRFLKNEPLEKLKGDILAKSRECGFDQCHFAPARLDKSAGLGLRAFVEEGYHGDMVWMKASADRRASPEHMWPQARTAIIFAMNYSPPDNPLGELLHKNTGYISVYARNRDYHQLIKGRLKLIAQHIGRRARELRLTAPVTKIFTDTAPIMEKPLAMEAGLGWQGKHTNLVSRRLGSWFFLGEILVDLEIPPDQSEADHCGRCRACLDICPTKAFPAPYQLDARRCISYLTIEHKGPIARELRPKMGNRIYGCDDCLAICPWNKFAHEAQEIKLRARADLTAPPLDELARLDDRGFREKFSASPIKRIGRGRFLRNVAIAIGNSGRRSSLSSVLELIGDSDGLIRGAAIWALSRIADFEEFVHYRRHFEPGERDKSVCEEWQASDPPGHN